MSSHIPPKYRDHTRDELLNTLAPNLEALFAAAGNWTSQAADAWVRAMSAAIRHETDAYTKSAPSVRKTIEHEATIDCLDPIRRDPRCPPALCEAIERHLRWRMRALHLTAFKEKAVASAGYFHHAHP